MKNIKYNILEQIITEGRLEDMIKKYEGTIGADEVRKLSAGDPSGNNKYLDWMCSQSANNNYNSEYIIKMVQCFHQNVNRLSEKNVNAIFTDLNPDDKIKKAPKDINSYPDAKNIDLICKYFEEQKPRTASRIKLYEDDKWLVVSPLTHEASCQYGAHSNWCVSTSNESYYKRYTQDGILVFFLDKKGTNPNKPNANIYKIAVNIKNDRPNPIQWDWYSMEDTRTDSALMMNLLPKHLIDVTEKYFEEYMVEVRKKFAINEKELADNSLIMYKDTQYNRVFLFLDLENWSSGTIETKTQFLKKYNDDIVTDITRYKESGLPYVKIQMYEGNTPDVIVSYVSWTPALALRRADNTIPLSGIMPRMVERYNSVNSEIRSVIPVLSPEDKEKFLDSYVKMFNEAKINKKENTSTMNLNVGDKIIYTGSRRGWGSGEEVKVTRVAEKSIQLSNGKRVARTYSNYKYRITGIIKIVDDRGQQPAPTPIPESRWIRKRII